VVHAGRHHRRQVSPVLDGADAGMRQRALLVGAAERCQ
jgi:hypothetical protein